MRAHFEGDAAARQLLADVRQFSKEPTPPTLRRLELLDGVERVCVVYAPVLRAHVPLEAVLSTARRLLAAPAECTPVLWVRDWSAIALDCYAGQPKAIAASFGVLLGALRALFPALMGRTRVLLQSEAILRDPSAYWISAIDVGRRFSLQQLTALEPPPASEQAGFVVKVLMHVADALALSPSHVCCDPAEAELCGFAEAYRAAHAPSLPATRVAAIEPCAIRLRDPAGAGGFAAEAECEYTVLDSAAGDAPSKMKKAFCALGDADKNPPLRIAQELMRHGGARAAPQRARAPRAALTAPGPPPAHAHPGRAQARSSSSASPSTAATSSTRTRRRSRPTLGRAGSTRATSSPRWSASCRRCSARSRPRSRRRPRRRRRRATSGRRSRRWPRASELD